MVHLAMQLAPTHAMRKSRLFVMVISSPIILHSPLLTLLGVQPIVMLSVSHKRVDLSPTLFLVCLLASSTSVVAKRPADGSPLAETSLGPEHDPYNVLDHIIPNVLTGITFGFVLTVALAQTLCMLNWDARWMAGMVVGAHSASSIRCDVRNQEVLTCILLGRLAMFLGSGNICLWHQVALRLSQTS
ncbi:hypothetical protein BC827DRAFT_781021 [Russula dissimulans]|nr:hypothetical protein BC827DRAFT_781021 [Russula dissimulans]